jgi:hypothetical protein
MKKIGFLSFAAEGMWSRPTKRETMRSFELNVERSGAKSTVN